jgi:2'-5' RNA ligase
VRLFLAINLESGIRRAILDATAPLRTAAPTLSWVDDSRLHLTLKFLGEQTEDLVPRLNDALDDVSKRHRRFSISVREIGAFPNFRRARVVWMGVEQEPRLELLHHDVEVACEALGFELEGRAFRPHLTLARVRDRTDEDELRRLSRASKRIEFEQESEVESIDLMHSKREGGQSVARYVRLHAAALRPPPN